MQNKNKYEIIIFGRGGQGAKTMSEIMAQAGVLDGKSVQAFPEFGPERSGAPVKAFVRISDEPITSHEPIVHPDCFLLLDESLLTDDYFSLFNFSGSELLIINTKKTAKEIKEKIHFGGKIIAVDADEISMEIIGEKRPSNVILGRFAFVVEKIKIENIKKVFREKYLSKIGKEKTEKNILTIMKAYDTH